LRADSRRPSRPGFLNDLHVYEPAAKKWTALSYAPLSPRWVHGFVAAGGGLYLHGGSGYSGKT
jgi:hypothetical protein